MIHRRNYLNKSHEDVRFARLVWNKKKTSYRYTLNPIYSKKYKIPFWQNFSNSCCDLIKVNGLEKDISGVINYPVYKIKLTEKNIFTIKKWNH